MINTISKILSLLLLTQTPSVNAARTIEIEWVIPAENTTYANEIVAVGDKALFFWSKETIHNVQIHPYGKCNQGDSKYVGANYEGTPYTFTEKDAGKELTFACDIGSRPNNHCGFGQIIKFEVMENTNTDTEVADGTDGEDTDGGNVGVMEIVPDILEIGPDIFEGEEDEEPNGAAGLVRDGRFGMMWGGIVSLLYVTVW